MIRSSFRELITAFLIGALIGIILDISRAHALPRCPTINEQATNLGDQVRAAAEALR